MRKGIKEAAAAHGPEPVSLSELIHQHVRIAIETAVPEELRTALGTTSYERSKIRCGYRNGTKARMLTGPTGPVALTLPREDAAVVLPFSLVATGQIKLRRIDGWRKIATVRSQNTLVAA